MKVPALLAALTACTVASAAAPSAEIWACQDHPKGAGFVWQNETWNQRTFSVENHLVKVNGEASEHIVGGHSFGVNCRDHFGNLIRCTNWKGTTIMINRENGSGAIASLFGAVYVPANGRRDTVTVSVVKCTRL